MSHFTVTVCLDGQDPHLARAIAAAGAGFPLRKIIESHLERVLAPFDEGREVEPYRDYEEGSPEDYWFTRSVRRGAESHRQLLEKGADALAAERIGRHSDLPDDISLGAEAVRDQAPGWAADSALDRELGKNPSWSDVARVYNTKYGNEETPLLTDDAGRAYTMSTYNPQSKWDWWVIGGRWPGRLAYRKGRASEVIPSEAHWGAPDEKIPALHCDGGPLRALDLDRTREEAAAEARERHAEYLAAVAGTPEALPWSAFADNISEGSGYTAEQAREEYHSQPRIAALDASREFMWASNEDYQVPGKLHTERARAAAVPGYATLTADGRWMAPGEMGWFGMSTDGAGDRIGYLEAACAYIGSLPDDAWIVSIDCHI